jgi:cAMP-binding proteins - catabolite gene activator and regulatory subunit of cAMP-dependent protein kinases
MSRTSCCASQPGGASSGACSPPGCPVCWCCSRRWPSVAWTSDCCATCCNAARKRVATSWQSPTRPSPTTWAPRARWSAGYSRIWHTAACWHCNAAGYACTARHWHRRWLNVT